MEFEIKPGVFIGVVTRHQWHRRVNALDAEDRLHFKEKCNPFWKADNKSLLTALGFNLVDLLYVCKYIDPDFDVDGDYYTVRNVPMKEIDEPDDDERSMGIDPYDY